MIVIVKDSEVKSLIEELSSIEEKFWINYRNFHKEQRLFIEQKFEDIYAKLNMLIDDQGEQLSYEERTVV